MIIEAAAAAAGRFADICTVVYDGVLGPWFLPTFVRVSGLAYLHYVILLPPLEVCLERVQNRADHGFGDLSVTGDLYEPFAGTDVDRRHVINESDDHPAKVAELISGGLGVWSVSVLSRLILVGSTLSLSKGAAYVP